MPKDLNEKVIDLEKKYEQLIKDDPIKQAAIALGVGVAIGLVAALLMKRK